MKQNEVCDAHHFFLSACIFEEKSLDLHWNDEQFIYQQETKNQVKPCLEISMPCEALAQSKYNWGEY